MNDLLSIDELALDREWLEQPSNYLKASRQLADAKQVLDAAKNELEVVKAEQYRAILTYPERYGLAKTTEAAIASAIPLQKAYQEAQREVIRARHDVDVRAAVVTAMEHRKKALENLVSLHLSGYYSDPKAKREDAEYVEELEARRRSRSARKHQPTGGK